MAAEGIKVDAKVLKQLSNDIKTNHKNMCSYLAESKTTVKNLKSTWTGTGANEFYSRFDAIVAKCEETAQSIYNFSVTLSEASDVYSSTEKKVSDTAGKLKINLK